MSKVVAKAEKKVSILREEETALQARLEEVQAQHATASETARIEAGRIERGQGANGAHAAAHAKAIASRERIEALKSALEQCQADIVNAELTLADERKKEGQSKIADLRKELYTNADAIMDMQEELKALHEKDREIRGRMVAVDREYGLNAGHDGSFLSRSVESFSTRAEFGAAGVIKIRKKAS